MLPIILNPKVLRIGLSGRGEGFGRRLAMITGAGVTAPVLFESRPASAGEIAALHVLFIAGLDEAESRALSSAARAAGVLVNVEDRPELCDFHVPAIVRRRDLLLTISTGGRSPAVAHILREELEKHFGPEWEERLDEIADARDAWRASGLTSCDVAERTGRLIDAKGWRQ